MCVENGVFLFGQVFAGAGRRCGRRDSCNRSCGGGRGGGKRAGEEGGSGPAGQAISSLHSDGGHSRHLLV